MAKLKTDQDIIPNLNAVIDYLKSEGWREATFSESQLTNFGSKIILTDNKIILGLSIPTTKRFFGKEKITDNWFFLRTLNVGRDGIYLSCTYRKQDPIDGIYRNFSALTNKESLPLNEYLESINLTKRAHEINEILNKFQTQDYNVNARLRK